MIGFIMSFHFIFHNKIPNTIPITTPAIIPENKVCHHGKYSNGVFSQIQKVFIFPSIRLSILQSVYKYTVRHAGQRANSMSSLSMPPLLVFSSERDRELLDSGSWFLRRSFPDNSLDHPYHRFRWRRYASTVHPFLRSTSEE